MAILKYLRVGDTAELKPNGVRWLQIPGHGDNAGNQSGIVIQSEDGTNHWMWFSDASGFYYKTSEPTTDTDGTEISASSNAALAGSVIADEAIVIGVGGVRGVEACGITVNDSDNVAGMGTLGVGTITSTGNLVIADAGTIGSATDTSAITIASDGKVTLTDDLTVNEDILIGDSKYIGSASDPDALQIDSSGNLILTQNIHLDADNLEVQLGAETSDSYMKFDGTDLLFYDTAYGSAVSLSTLVSGTPLNPIVTGDLVISDGQFDWTNSAAGEINLWAFSNSSADVLHIEANSLDSETVIDVSADAITSGAFLKFNRGDSEIFKIKRYGEIEIAGLTDNDMITITAGNFNMADGTLNVTDADDNTLVTLVNDAVTTTYLMDINADGMTSGTFIHLDTNQGASFSGNYIDASADGSHTSEFTVKRFGATTLLGTAGGTDVLTLTKGDLQVDDGSLEVDADSDIGSYFKKNFSGGSAVVFLVENTHTTGTGFAAKINQKATGGAGGLDLVNDGDSASLKLSADAARTGYVIEIPMANQLAEEALLISGDITSAAGEGVVHIDLGTGVLNATGNALLIEGSGNHASASHMVELNYDTGTVAVATSGMILGVYDTSGAQATSYAVEISSTNNEALHVNAGLSQFDEGLVSGVDGTTVGHADFFHGASTNTPSYIMLDSVDGTPTYLFAANNGTLRYHSAVPTANADGTQVNA